MSDQTSNPLEDCHFADEADFDPIANLSRKNQMSNTVTGQKDGEQGTQAPDLVDWNALSKKCNEEVEEDDADPLNTICRN